MVMFIQLQKHNKIHVYLTWVKLLAYKLYLRALKSILSEVCFEKELNLKNYSRSKKSLLGNLSSGEEVAGQQSGNKQEDRVAGCAQIGKTRGEQQCSSIRGPEDTWERMGQEWFWEPMVEHFLHHVEVELSMQHPVGIEWETKTF